MAGLNWSVKGFKALELVELYRILRLREEVFMLEQQCLYRDIDDRDQGSVHVMGCDPSNNALAAYARVVPPGLTFADPSIGRVVTAPQYRGLALGKELMQHSILAARKEYPGSAIRISAQAHLQRFYSEFGFVAEGNIYLEDGIDHIAMVLDPPTARPALDFHTHRRDPATVAIYNLNSEELEQFAAIPHPTSSSPGKIGNDLCSAGIHPWDVQPDDLNAQLQQLRQVADLPQVALIGECGLDKLKGPALSIQASAFIKQAEIAVQYQKPVVIHCVKAYDELIRIQRDYQFASPMIIHGFNKSPQMAQQLTSHGFLLSFGAALLANDQLAESLTFLFENDIPFFLETDDSPIAIDEIYAHAANLLKISNDQLKDVIFAAWKKIGLEYG